MREIKFRAWTDKKEMINPVLWIGEYNHFYGEDFTNNQYGNIIDIMQFTGLKDKSGLTEIYEGDILDENGFIRGNIHEMDKRETDTIIQGFGTKAWCETVSRAILLGCRYSE